MTRDRQLLVRSILSGALSYALVEPLNRLFGAHDLGQVLPGVLFGALVLGPAVPAGARRYTRWALAIILSAVTYSLAVKLAVELVTHHNWKDLPACALAGFLGALAVGLLCQFVVGRSVAPRRLSWAAAAGLLTGTLFGLKGTFGLPSGLEVCTLVAGFICWQTSVAWALLRE